MHRASKRHGLARWISKFGLMSRTEAERAVADGRVALNGKVIVDPGKPCHPDSDTISLDGRRIRPQKRIYLAMNKPRGAITSARDPKGRPTVYDLLPPGSGHAQAAGRLDADTSGLLIFTNDTEFAAGITEAGGIEKAYRVRIGGEVRPEDTRRLETGIEIDGKLTLPARLKVLEKATGSYLVEMVIKEGRNRQVRRMWEALGYEVLDLERVRIGPIELGDLPTGRTRPLTEYERVLLKLSSQGADSSSPRRSSPPGPCSPGGRARGSPPRPGRGT